MIENKITDIKKWFKDYTVGFYSDNEKINTNIKLKIIHTFKVVDEIENLSDELNLSPRKKAIAIIIGLVHDCGRFEQLSRYQTFEDSKSINHALLGIEIIDRYRLIVDLPLQTQLVIKEAVRNHNSLSVEIAPNMPEDAHLMAKIIRDADKLDIFRVVKTSYEQYIKEPQKANNLAICFDADTGKATPQVVEDVFNRRQVDYRNLNTLDDRKLLQLCWVYDINFPETLKKILNRGYVDMIFKALPQSDEMEKVKQTVRQYVNEIFPGYYQNNGG